MKEVDNMSQGLISLFIPILVIIMAMWTKKIISSLIIGVLAGGILLKGGTTVLQNRFPKDCKIRKIN